METAYHHANVFNENRCSIKTSSLIFFGLLFDQYRFYDPGHVNFIEQMHSPNSTQIISEFLDVVTYMTLFKNNLDISDSIPRPNEVGY